MKRENAFFAILGKVRAAKRDATTLILIDGDGRELARERTRS